METGPWQRRGCLLASASRAMTCGKSREKAVNTSALGKAESQTQLDKPHMESPDGQGASVLALHMCQLVQPAVHCLQALG